MIRVCADIPNVRATQRGSTALVRQILLRATSANAHLISINHFESRIFGSSSRDGPNNL